MTSVIGHVLAGVISTSRFWWYKLDFVLVLDRFGGMDMFESVTFANFMVLADHRATDSPYIKTFNCARSTGCTVFFFLVISQ